MRSCFSAERQPEGSGNECGVRLAWTEMKGRCCRAVTMAPAIPGRTIMAQLSSSTPKHLEGCARSLPCVQSGQNGLRAQEDCWCLPGQNGPGAQLSSRTHPNNCRLHRRCREFRTEWAEGSRGLLVLHTARERLGEQADAGGVDCQPCLPAAAGGKGESGGCGGGGGGGA